MRRFPDVDRCGWIRWAVAAALVAAAALAGCDTGSRHKGTGRNGPRPIQPDEPLLYRVKPLEACAGESITMEGQNFSLVPEENIVIFRSSKDPDYVVPGVVRTATKSRLHVTVPGGILNGTVELTVIVPSGEPVSAGLTDFGACPMVTGVALGTDGRDGVVELVGNQFRPNRVTIYGYNLENAVTVDMEDEGRNNVVKITSLQSSQLPPAVRRDPKISAVSVEIPDDFIFFGLDAYPIMVRVNTPEKSSNYGSFMVRKPGVQIGAIVSGISVPSGNRTGVVEVRYNVFVEEGPPNFFNEKPWNLIAEFSRDSGNTWNPASSAGSTDGDDRTMDIVPGDREFPSEIGQLVGPGLTYRFRWDSELDMPGVVDTIMLRFRLSPTDAVQSNLVNTFESAWIYVDNGSTFRSGSVVERFDDTEFEDLALTTASWAYPSGVASGTIGTTPPGGLGTEDVVLEPIELTDGQGAYKAAYVFDTNRGRIYYSTRDGGASGVEFTVDNPGQPLGEFHFRTLEIPEGVVARGIGSRPLVIRLSGTGDPDEIAFRLKGTIEGDGQDGESGGTGDAVDPPVAGKGGAGGPGGGKGGDGGVVLIDSQFVVQDATHATDGEGAGGGLAGQTMSYRNTQLGPTNQPEISDVFGGSGGGASYGTLGGTGQAGGSLRNLPPRRNGAPGPVYGTESVIPLLGGSGGGGGGGYLYRATGSLEWNGGGGSGGGGGGGALHVVVAGSAVVDGEISMDGGKGGDKRSRGGSGGGGSGGAVLVQATGTIELGTSADVHALGGDGGNSRSGSTSRRAIGGDGGDGRIRFEAGKGVNLPGLVADSAFYPDRTSSSVTAGPAADPIDGGDGADGSLNLPGGSASAYQINTDTGEIHHVSSGSLLLTAESGGGEFRFVSLSIPRDATVRVVGSQPLVIRVQEDAIIEGTIVVAGSDAAEANAVDGLPGEAGRGGPGGGGGGGGGFVDAGSIFHGEPGGLPALLPPSLILDGPLYGSRDPAGVPIPPGMASPALGGETVRTLCGACVDTGGGGGGGGYGGRGSDGIAVGTLASAGSGGTAYGSAYFLSPIDGSFLPLGGAGGAGGGGNVNGSAPGTSGAGGGGFFQLSVAGSLVIGQDAVIDATGGDAYASVAGGGNGGAGSGGAVLVQVDGVLIIEEGARIDVRGGQANLPPTGYTGNSAQNGGAGAAGRIRIESNVDFSGQLVNVRPDATAGSYRGSAVRSVAISKRYRLAIGGSFTSSLVMGVPNTTIAGGLLPPGTRAVLLLEGASESADVFGAPGRWRGPTTDYAQLDGSEFGRFQLWFESSVETGEVPEVDTVEILFDMPAPVPPPPPGP